MGYGHRVGTPRRGMADLWNARFLNGAEWTPSDNPVARSTATKPPDSVISYKDAVKIHRAQLAAGNFGYRHEAFIHTCMDDQKFDGIQEGIWFHLERFLDMASHFGGIVCVDFSTYADLPEPIKRWQYFRIRTVEYAAAQREIPVIVNARWDTRDSWEYSLYELPESAILSVGTVGSGLKRLENRPAFDAGLREIVLVKKPVCLVVIGSADYDSVRDAEARGVQIVQFDGETAKAHKKRRCAHE